MPLVGVLDALLGATPGRSLDWVINEVCDVEMAGLDVDLIDELAGPRPGR